MSDDKERIIRQSEVAEHKNTKGGDKSVWITVHDGVYDVTKFLDEVRPISESLMEIFFSQEFLEGVWKSITTLNSLVSFWLEPVRSVIAMTTTCQGSWRQNGIQICQEILSLFHSSHIREIFSSKVVMLEPSISIC